MQSLGRREVLTGRQIWNFGDGKEVPQLAMAKFFQKRDFRSVIIAIKHL
jgi:hypothetical protein